MGNRLFGNRLRETARILRGEPSPEDEPRVRRYRIYLCDLCVAGKGGECHTPGCALCWNRAPDIALHPKPGSFVEEITDGE